MVLNEKAGVRVCKRTIIKKDYKYAQTMYLFG